MLHHSAVLFGAWKKLRTPRRPPVNHKKPGFRSDTSYISLSIAFKLPNKELRGEMIREKYRLRGIIYDMLTEEVNGLKEVPRIEKIKECIIRAINGAVSMGKINDAYITDLLAV